MAGMSWLMQQRIIWVGADDLAEPQDEVSTASGVRRSAAVPVSAQPKGKGSADVPRRAHGAFRTNRAAVHGAG